MKALFLGHFAATVGPRILAKVKTPLDTSILDDEGDVKQLAPLLADAEIVIGHIWRAGFPPAPRRELDNLSHGSEAGSYRVRLPEPWQGKASLKASIASPARGLCRSSGCRSM